MKLKTSRPMDGVRWMREGLMVFRQQPWAFASLVALLMLIMGFVLMLPVVGPLLVLACLPGLTAGWVACSDGVRKQERPGIPRLLSPFLGPHRKGIWALGAVYALCGWLVLQALDLADPSFREQWQIAISPGDDAARSEAMVAAQQGMLLRGVCLLPLVLAFWHAPVIVNRGYSGAAQALFTSVVASVRHFAALTVYGLTWLAADVAMSVVLSMLLDLLGAGPWALAIALPVSLFFCAAFFASLQATVDGCVSPD